MRLISIVLVVFTLAAAACAQQGKWADANDPTVKFMIDSERQWAEAACNHNKIAQTILADDFQGTLTDGTRYTKAEEVAANADLSNTARDCGLMEAKVRFFGDSLAIVYGGDSSLRKTSDGTEKRRCQLWTDTWLKRNGKWQIIAAQDGVVSCK